MVLISSTRTLSSPLPIDTDPILNYPHIQPAAAAAAVVPWLHHTSTIAPSSPHSFSLQSNNTTTIGSCSIFPQLQLLPPFTTLSSSKPSLPPASLSDSSSASPSSTLSSIHLSAASATSGSTPSFHPHSVSNLLSSSPPSIMLPNPTSDDDSADEDPSRKPPSAGLASAAATPQQFESHSSSLNLYDLPSSSSAPPTSSSFTPRIPQHHQPAYSSPHPNLDNHQQQQFYHPSPPALPSPIHPNPPQHSFDHHPHPSLFLPHQPYHSHPQSAPHSATQAPLDPKVLAAAAHVEVKKWDEENTFYYQVIHKGIAVGRVKGSGLVNGTKLLNLSGISRGKRDGILKNEKIRKVVKHGTMHLKGVWIAFDRACTLAEQYDIADKIFPLLDLNLEHYVHIEQPILGAPKLGSNSLFHHHRGHPRFLPEPIKFSPAGVSHAPTSTGSFSSAGGWSAGPLSGRGIDFGEPYSAPPVGRSDTGVPSVYEQAQYEYLNAPNSANPDLLERRHTIPNNFNGYHPMAPFASQQPSIPYPFQYNPSHLGANPPRSSASDSTTQFEYPSKNHLDVITNRNGAGAHPSLYHSQPSSTRPPSTTGTHPSPALHSAPLILSPLPSSNQILDHTVNDFRVGNDSSSHHAKEKAEEDGPAEGQPFRNLQDCAHENNRNSKPSSFQDEMSSSGNLPSPFPNWNVNQSAIMKPATSQTRRIHRSPHGDHLAEESTIPGSAKCPDGQTSNAIPGEMPHANNSQFNGGNLSRSSNGDYQHSHPHSQNAQDAGFHMNNLHHPMGSATNTAHHNW